MFPYGMQFMVAVIVMVITIKFSFVYAMVAYMAYRFFLKL